MTDPADVLSLVVFVATGVAICWLNHRLHAAEAGQRAAAEAAMARAERLDAILNMTVDGIFTPFFTTMSRGTDLGLPTVKRLVEAHNGQVMLDCPPAGGTRVVIRLPLGSA